MRILLIGEYSRLHNSLKEALVQLGHDVTIVGNGDGFKNFPVDINIDAAWCKKGFPNLVRQAIFRIFRYDFAALEYAARFNSIVAGLKDYDIVQLISEMPVQTNPEFEYAFLKKLKAQNKKIFLLSSGTDVPFLKAVYGKKFRYSLMDPYFQDKKTIREYRHVLINLSPAYQKHHEKVYQMINGVIATDLDYAIGLDGHPKFLGMIPNPVQIDQYSTMPEITGPIAIFHGINRWNYHKKGSVYFEKALDIIAKKYGDKIKIITADTLPYDQYINMYNEAHILLDQVYAYDQGYNALEAMSRGKVVFTGAEKEFTEYYKLAERVCINALPDTDSIVAELSALIEDPREITAMGNRAKSFIEKEHDSMKIAKKYLETWQNH